jgi:hypothetical protein
MVGMTMMESRPMPPASQLIQQGFQHWRVHQRAFWLLAGLSAIGIVVLKMVIPGGSSAVVAGLYIFIFDQWMKLALFPDWKQREPALRKSKEGRRLAQPRWAFWGFGFAYAFVVFAAGTLLIVLVAPEIFRGRMETSTALLSALSLGLAMCLATLIFAPSLLYLPAGIAGFKWNLGDAFREASGIRGSLMALAMWGTLIALVGPLLISLNTLFLPPGFLLLALAFQVLAGLLDLFALYLVAYGTARLFIAKTGWQPAPLPEA